jgi:hypothetical protein
MMDFTQLPLDFAGLLALAAGLGWASGFRLYTTIFIVGLAGKLGWVVLPQGLRLIEHPWVLGAAGLMLMVEFLADKVPLLDSVWDTVHTFIRIPAGAALAPTSPRPARAPSSTPRPSPSPTSPHRSARTWLPSPGCG